MPMKDKAEQLKYQTAWLAKRRADWMAANGPCACGTTEGLELEWVTDAPKPKHSHGSSLFSLSKEKRDAVLKNYRVVCRPCREVRFKLPPEKQKEVIEVLMAGYGTRAAAILTGVDRNTCQKYAARLSGLENCACGKPPRHHGPCWWRVSLRLLNHPRVDDIRQLRRARRSLLEVRNYLKEKSSGQ